MDMLNIHQFVSLGSARTEFVALELQLIDDCLERGVRIASSEATLDEIYDLYFCEVFLADQFAGYGT
jgi:hypothetical protein